jgi:accessory gene regulator protein AgrB
MFARLLLLVLIALAMVFIARQKGFNPLYWVIAGSVIGLIVLLFLPAATQHGISDEEREKRVKTGNMIGIFLSSIILIFAGLAAGLIFFPGYL